MCELRLEVGKTYVNENDDEIVKIIDEISYEHAPKGTCVDRHEQFVGMVVDSCGNAVDGKYIRTYFTDGRYTKTYSSDSMDLKREFRPKKKAVLISYEKDGILYTCTRHENINRDQYHNLSALSVGDDCSRAVGSTDCERRTVKSVQIIEY